VRSIALASLLLAAGCATMINGTTQRIPVASSPRNALVTLECPGEPPRDAGKTPMTVELRRDSEGCRITLSKLGYRHVSVRVTRRVSAAAAFDAVPGAVLGSISGLFTYVPLAIAGVPDDEANAIGTSAMRAGASAPFKADERAGGAFRLEPERVDVALQPLP